MPPPFAVDWVRCSHYESSPDCILTLDPAGNVQAINPSGARLLGLRNDGALLGARWLTLWAEADQPLAVAALDAAAVGETQRFAASLETELGETRHIDNIVSPLCDETGQPIAFLITSRDVTELAATLMASSRRGHARWQSSTMRTAAEMAKVAGWELDFRTGLVWTAIEGVPALQGSPDRRVQTLERALANHLPEDQARIREQLERARQHGERVRYDVRFTGTEPAFWVRVMGEPFYQGGVCIGVRGAAMDISEEVAAREWMQRAQQRLNIAAQLTGIEVFEIDFDRQMLIREEASASLFEDPLRYDELRPHALDLVDPRDRARVRREWDQAQNTQAPFRSEFRLRRRDGREVWVYGVARMVQEDERPRRLVGAMMDITQRKHSELEILDKMSQMREHEARQKLLIDEVNHRVKNTLATVQSIAGQTFKNLGDPGAAQDLFLERLLALSATHNLLVRRSWESASFQELVHISLKPYGQAYQYEGPDVRLDPNFAVSLGMALHELATNALKHGAWRQGGQVSIITEADDLEVRFTWRETRGPPVLPPAQTGFGTRLLQRGVARELGGTVDLDFASGGLACTIRAPASARLRAD